MPSPVPPGRAPRSSSGARLTWSIVVRNQGRKCWKVDRQAEDAGTRTVAMLEKRPGSRRRRGRSHVAGGAMGCRTASPHPLAPLLSARGGPHGPLNAPTARDPLGARCNLDTLSGLPRDFQLELPPLTSPYPPARPRGRAARGSAGAPAGRVGPLPPLTNSAHTEEDPPIRAVLQRRCAKSAHGCCRASSGEMLDTAACSAFV